MINLTDTQAILLSTASQRDTMSILPLPASVKASGAGKAIAALIKRGYAEEQETTGPTALHRTDGDLSYGVFATTSGMDAIGIPSEDDATSTTATSPAPAPDAPAATVSRVSKSADVITLLQRSNGATLAELIALTGWLPHTTRAALTGLRKKGHAVVRSKRDGATCYAIAAAA